jgi:hypothetical protein
VKESVRQRVPPEVLPRSAWRTPGLRPRGQALFSDENLDLLAHLLDDWFRIPGTPIRLGLDGIIGLIPGIGDVIAGVASSILIVAAWMRGVPYVTLTRMTLNVGLAVLVGSVPLFGDLFDILWQTNRRNYRLMTRHLRQPHRHTWKDAAFLLSLLMAVLLILATPVIVVVLIALWIVHRV